MPAWAEVSGQSTSLKRDVVVFDGGDNEIKAGCALTLIFEGAVADFAKAMKEHGAREHIASLAIVKSGARPPTQGGALI
jgi:hypothetical protein